MTPELVADAVRCRAPGYARVLPGRGVRRYADQIRAASWDSVIFDVPGEPMLRRVPMPEPQRGTREHVGALLDRSPDAAALLAELVAGR